jgi:hypothetical protein
MNKISFEAYENIGIGITNPRSVTKFTGPPEDLEKLIAVWIQSGYEVDGITEEEKQKYLDFDCSGLYLRVTSQEVSVFERQLRD